MLGQSPVNGARVSVAGRKGRALPIYLRVGRSPRPQSVDITIEHTKGSSDEHGVMYFHIACAALAGAGYIFSGYLFAALLHLARDGDQRFYLVRDGCLLRIAFNLEYDLHVVVQMVCSHGSMNVLAEEAVVPRRDEGGDQLALAGRELFVP